MRLCISCKHSFHDLHLLALTSCPSFLWLLVDCQISLSGQISFLWDVVRVLIIFLNGSPLIKRDRTSVCQESSRSPSLIGKGVNGRRLQLIMQPSKSAFWLSPASSLMCLSEGGKEQRKGLGHPPSQSLSGCHWAVGADQVREGRDAKRIIV